jgi:hypothetical protein
MNVCTGHSVTIADPAATTCDVVNSGAAERLGLIAWTSLREGLRHNLVALRAGGREELAIELSKVFP